MNYKELCCMIIDSDMNTWVLKQAQVQSFLAH